MGQTASSPEIPIEWLEILPNITQEDILLSSKKRCRVSEDKKVFLNNELFDLDEHVPLAVEILSAHPPLKDVRFKLVPGKMFEERFWAALFGILNDDGIEAEQAIGDVGVGVDDNYQPEDDDNDGVELESQVLCNPRIEPVNCPNSSGKHDEVYYDTTFFRDEIKRQYELISRLQRSLREANHKIRTLGLELHKERKNRLDAKANGIDGKSDYDVMRVEKNLLTCPRCNSKIFSLSSHCGTWEMHPDCKEFLKLDEHLKENLRKEKQKRMNEVLSQMKFILDTEELKDTYGKWTCCGKEQYEAEGCTPTK